MNVSLSRYGHFLAAYLAPQWPRALALAALLFSTVAAQVVNPQILRYVLDTAMSGGPLPALVAAALLFLAIGILTQLLAAGTAYVSADVGWRATNRLRADLILHCLRLDLPFHAAHTPGELIERIDGDVSALANFLSRFVISLLGSMLLVLGVLVALLREDARAGLALSVFALVTLRLLRRVRGAAAPYWAAGRQASADLFGFLEERLGGIHDVRANGAVAYTMLRLHRALRAHFRARRTARMMSEALVGAAGLLLTLGSVGALALGAYLFIAHRATIGTVYLIVTYTGLLLRPLRDISTQIGDLQQAGASIARIDALARTAPLVRDGPGPALPAGALSVRVDGVSFRYETGDLVLRDVSFALRPGTMVGLLGRTGSGKTTLTRLLCRLYDPTAGTILLDGQDVRMAHMDDLRRHIGVVTQDVQLFQASVRDNLTFFDPDVPDGRIIRAIEEVGLSAWYAGLPRGLDTEIGASGAGLSAGEAQLLAFARVFLRDPGLLILDEASSRLDPATDALIARAVDRLLAGRTAIIVAHRLATVRRVDEIMILEEGRLIEHGDRAALARDPSSRFSRLLRAGLAEALA